MRTIEGRTYNETQVKIKEAGKTEGGSKDRKLKGRRDRQNKTVKSRIGNKRL